MHAMSAALQSHSCLSLPIVPSADGAGARHASSPHAESSIDNGMIVATEMNAPRRVMSRKTGCEAATTGEFQRRSTKPRQARQRSQSIPARPYIAYLSPSETSDSSWQCSESEEPSEHCRRSIAHASPSRPSTHSHVPSG
eukprot:2580026-Pleurochrysis_carterae.AAC.2